MQKADWVSDGLREKKVPYSQQIINYRIGLYSFVDFSLLLKHLWVSIANKLD